MSILQNAAEVLRCFSTETPELTVTDVAVRLDLPKASASRLMKAMREAGMLETVGLSKRHRPGLLLLDLAAAFRSSSRLITRASAAVAKVSRQFGHTGYVSIRDRREVTAVVDFEGTNALRVVSNIGRRLKAHESATGRTLLARMPDPAIAALYGDHPGLAEVMRHVTRVRENGFAYSNQEATRGVDAIALSVADPMSHEAVSLCVVFPHALVDEAARMEIVSSLAEEAARIADELGDTAFVAPRSATPVTEKGLPE
ncbi:transcriptional regulator [Haematobacter missouriensis]|uniref:IclR family transcriptional regulator n=1 Tax=Haematobacter missouriensis TaxID=366616 RepID=A0A212ANC9_9RHOB|nr:IclR family transcriptional regulator [Haematobacter missouriensis]KFI25089.1 transcriptional regulator [Haematobacter missouriensis]OWJ73847.1 IclR family transcriptional regulator [Haematobacter missouriensis]OWJ83018.1 IclR family transcriptional regulator [Haematobacter missouriensis]